MSDQRTLAARLQDETSSAARSWIITEMLLQTYSEELRKGIIAVAVPHWFNEEILAVLFTLNTEMALARYIDLQELSIVQTFGNLGHTLHDLTRNGILKYLITEQRTELQHYSEMLLLYFVTPCDLQQEVERIYHLLIAEPQKGRTLQKENVDLWLSKDEFAAVENLLRNYRELIDLGWLSDDDDRFELERQKYLTANALAKRGKLETDKQSEQYLRKAVTQLVSPDQLAKVLAEDPTQLREQIDYLRQDYVCSQIEHARMAKDVARQSLWMIELANIYRDQGDLESALQQLDQVVELGLTSARVWGQRGEIHRLLERYVEALTDYDCAIELDGTIVWAIAGRGETYRLLERYEEALEDYNRAIELDPTIDWVITKRELLYQANRLKQYEEQLKQYQMVLANVDKAIKLVRNEAQSKPEGYWENPQSNFEVNDLLSKTVIKASVPIEQFYPSISTSWQKYPVTYRSAEITTLVQWINIGASGIVLGLAGSGVSTLLRYFVNRPDVVSRASLNHIPIVAIQIDLHSIMEPVLPTIYRLCLQGILETTHTTRHELPADLAQSCQMQLANTDFIGLQTALFAVLGHYETTHYKLVFVLDRIDQLSIDLWPLVGNTLRPLRDRFRETLIYLMGIHIAPDYLEQIYELDDLGRLLSTHICTVGRLTEADSRFVIASRISVADKVPTENEIQQFLRLSGGYPTLLKSVIGWWMTQGSSLPPADWQNELQQEPGIQLRLREIGDCLSEEEKEALQAIRMGQRSEVIPAHIGRKLVHMGLCVQHKHGWELAGTLFQGLV